MMRGVMGSRMKVSVLFSSFVVTVLLVLGAVLGKSEEKEGAYRPLAVYTEVLGRIKSDYVEEPDIPKVTQGALQGLVEYLDPQSSYLSAEQYAEYLEALKNEDKGTGLATGMVVHKRVNYTTVMSVLPGSAADEAGIRPGDLVEAVEGMSTRVMPPAYLLAKLSGKPGTRVNVMIRPAADYDSPQEHGLQRSAVKLPDVESETIEEDVGLIKAAALTAEHVERIESAITALEADGARKLIVDLRGNSIGEIANGIRLADLFLDSGVIASAKGRKYVEKTFTADPRFDRDGAAGGLRHRPADIGRGGSRGRPPSCRTRAAMSWARAATVWRRTERLSSWTTARPCCCRWRSITGRTARRSTTRVWSPVTSWRQGTCADSANSRAPARG